MFHRTSDDIWSRHVIHWSLFRQMLDDLICQCVSYANSVFRLLSNEAFMCHYRFIITEHSTVHRQWSVLLTYWPQLSPPPATSCCSLAFCRICRSRLVWLHVWRTDTQCRRFKLILSDIWSVIPFKDSGMCCRQTVYLPWWTKQSSSDQAVSIPPVPLYREGSVSGSWQNWPRTCGSFGTSRFKLSIWHWWPRHSPCHSKIQILSHQSIFGVVHSYLTDRTQIFSTHSIQTPPLPFTHGVPQGSGLRSLTLVAYTSDIPNIFSSHNVQYHFYANDTQVYDHCTIPDSSADLPLSDLADAFILL